MGKIKEAALAQARMGLYVFPLIPGGKTPLHKGWQQEATTNAAEVEEFWDDTPKANIGVLAGKGHMVLDVDMKSGVNGLIVLNELLIELDTNLPDTYLIRTPTGGFHRYYKAPPTKNTVGHLGEGLDTRGKGGYTVGWGSTIKGVEYALHNELIGMAEAPEWLLTKIGEAGEKADNSEESLVEEDEGAFQAAIEWVENSAPTAEWGEIDNTAIKVAYRLRDFGISQDHCRTLLEDWTETKCSDPMAESDLDRVARSAYSSAQNPGGSKNPRAQFSAIEPVVEKKDDALNIVWPTPEMLTKIGARQWIMAPRHMIDHISMTVAPGGTGKSIFALVECVAIATGRPLTGHEILRPGRTFYFNTEDPVEEIVRRLTAICLHFGIPFEEVMDNVGIKSGRDRPLILAEEVGGTPVIGKDAERLFQSVQDNEFRFVCIDPAIGAHRVNENDNNAINVFADALRAVSRRGDCGINLVHHTRKQARGDTTARNDDAARGASAFGNASRMTFTLTTMGPKEARKLGVPDHKMRYHLRCDMVKGTFLPPAESAEWFRLVSVKLNNGDSVGVIEPVDLRESAERVKEQVNLEELQLAEHLADYLIETGGDDRSLTECAKTILSFYPHMYDMSEQKMRRDIQKTFAGQGYDLMDKGLVVRCYEVNGKPKFWVTVEDLE